MQKLLIFLLLGFVMEPDFFPITEIAEMSSIKQCSTRHCCFKSNWFKI